MPRFVMSALLALVLTTSARADVVRYPTFPATAERAADGRVVVTPAGPAEATAMTVIVQAPAEVLHPTPANQPFVVGGNAQVGMAIWIYYFAAGPDGVAYLGSSTAAVPPYAQLLPLVAR